MKAFHFWDDYGNSFNVPKDFIGELPEWAEHTRLYELAIKDGSITTIGEQTQVAVNVPDAAVPTADATVDSAPAADATAPVEDTKKTK